MKPKQRIVFSLLMAALIGLCFFLLAKHATNLAFPGTSEIYLDKLPTWAQLVNFAPMFIGSVAGSFHSIHVGTFFIVIILQWFILAYAASFLIWKKIK